MSYKLIEYIFTHTHFRKNHFLKRPLNGLFFIILINNSTLQQ